MYVVRYSTRVVATSIGKQELNYKYEREWLDTTSKYCNVTRACAPGGMSRPTVLNAIIPAQSNVIAIPSLDKVSGPYSRVQKEAGEDYTGL